jgi:hypothetical protein
VALLFAAMPSRTWSGRFAAGGRPVGFAVGEEPGRTVPASPTRQVAFGFLG